MKVVLLAGGLGSRLAEETKIKPKPMVKIGEKPIIEHIMRWYMSFGYCEFIICLGYKGSQIIDYFKNYHLRNSTITIDNNGKLETLEHKVQPWKIILAQTGIKTQTAGRIKKIKKFLKKDETFFMTYGDGLSDINLNKLFKFHNKNKKLATLTAVKPLPRFGALKLNAFNNVTDFNEKPVSEGGWINGGFFVLSEKVIDYIKSYDEAWEHGPLKRLVNKDQLMAYKHNGFWQPMDTLREKNILCELWKNNTAPWKVINNKRKIIPFRKAI